MPFVLTFLHRSLCAACFVSLAGAAHADAVQLRGSTTFLPMARLIAEAYMNEHPRSRVVVSGGGTARGYQSLIDGTTDIALASGPVPPELQKELDRRGIKLTMQTGAYSAIVAVVHPSNPVGGISSAQLKGIFTGRINDWKAVGGKGGAIKVLVGPPSGGITEIWKNMVIGDEDTYTSKGIVMDAEDRIAALVKDPQAITFISFGSIIHGIKPLKIDDVTATPGTVSGERYRLRTALTLVTTDKPSQASRDFIDYFLSSHKGEQFAALIKAPASSRPGTGHE